MRILDNKNYVEVTCPHCHSLLGIFMEDIRYYEMAHHGSPFQVTCGACDRAIAVGNIIPKKWQHLIAGDD